MSTFKPSVYQQKIYDFILTGSGNAVVSAVAGSGKTTTLINALKLIPSDKNVLFLAFNKSIAQELKERVPQDAINIDVKTVHSYGYGAMSREFKTQIDSSKYKKLLNDIVMYHQTNEFKIIKKYNFSSKYIKMVDDFKLDSNEIEYIEDKLGYYNRINTLCDLGRLNLVDLQNQDKGIDQLYSLANKHNVEIINGECYRAWLLINIGASYLACADFTDMVFLPNHYNLKLRQYDIVFIDECQDLNGCQRELMKRAIKKGTGRFIAVGDKHQCQPPETLVSLNDGKQVRIDELKIGDKLISYCARKGKGFVGFHKSIEISKRYSNNCDEVLGIKSRIYNGKLISITTEKSNNISKYTPNHKCLIKYKNTNRFILYLMEKNGLFRIGIHIAHSKHGFGLSVRSRQEKCSKSWILKTYETRELAYADEQFYSYAFGIPQLRFIDNKTGTMNQKTIEEIWCRFDKTKLYNNAINLLSFFNRIYEYPLFSYGDNIHHSRTGICEVQACNLIDDIMLVPVFDKTLKTPNKPHRASFESFKINIEQYNGLVYSLKVSNRELYVADNILTHNSIYGFAGADSDSFNKILDIKNTIQLPLSVCYRCGSDIIEYAKKYMPQIEASPTAKKGIIDTNFSYKNIASGDMVLCRNTMPLVSLCMKYLSSGIKAYVMGTDISASLIKMVESTRRKTEDFSIENVFSRIYREKEKLVNNIMMKEKITMKDAMEHSLVVSYSDKVMTLEVLSSGLSSGYELIDKLKEIFSDNSDGICLSTIHKSKGLEADRVFIIHKDLMPSKYAKQDWEKEQENNLIYVAYTRAKSYLGFVTDFDAYKDHESIECEENSQKIKDSEFQGKVGEKLKVKLTVIEIKEMNTSFGDTNLYEMVDDNGNIFSKFGNIPERFLVSNHSIVQEGSIVEFNATIKAHKEFKGIKTSVISNISVA